VRRQRDALPLGTPDLASGRRFLRDEVHRTIKEWILSREIRWGQELSEIELAGRLGVSRTPVREAFQRLEAEGLVSRTASGGVRVRSITASDIESIYEVLIPLYRLSAELAAEHWDGSFDASCTRLLESAERAANDPETIVSLHDEFHALLCLVGRNAWLLKSLLMLRDYTTAFRRTLVLDEKRRAAGEVEHRRLLELIRAHRTNEAGVFMADHIGRAREALLQTIGAQERDGELASDDSPPTDAGVRGRTPDVHPKRRVARATGS
jgi:DNA-binding GntR family transcriptional regulator